MLCARRGTWCVLGGKPGKDCVGFGKQQAAVFRPGKKAPNDLVTYCTPSAAAPPTTAPPTKGTEPPTKGTEPPTGESKKYIVADPYVVGTKKKVCINGEGTTTKRQVICCTDKGTKKGDSASGWTRAHLDAQGQKRGECDEYLTSSWAQAVEWCEEINLTLCTHRVIGLTGVGRNGGCGWKKNDMLAWTQNEC